MSWHILPYSMSQPAHVHNLGSPRSHSFACAVPPLLHLKTPCALPCVQTSGGGKLFCCRGSNPRVVLLCCYAPPMPDA